MSPTLWGPGGGMRGGRDWFGEAWGRSLWGTVVVFYGGGRVQVWGGDYRGVGVGVVAGEKGRLCVVTVWGLSGR